MMLCNIIIMQQKLIVTLWKAQFKDLPKESSVYTRFTYNGHERSSKPTSQSKNFAWKETFIFPLAKKQLPLRLEFISLPEGQEVHFARDNVVEAMSFGQSAVEIEVENVQHGSLPCKMDIINKKEESVGKIFIEYEIIKTEVAYAVEKQMDYFYLLKMTNFKVSFVRNLKKTPKFYLNFVIDGREHKQDLPFEQDDAGTFSYNYPVKLYLKKEIDMEIQLFVKDMEDYNVQINEYQTESSFNKSITSEDKTNKSSLGKKEKILLELGKDKIAGHMDLSFKKDIKLIKKIPLTTLVKFQKREIGQIQFQAEVIFKSKEQLQYLEEQKKGISPQKDSKSLQRKKSIVKQSNGIIIVNSILGRLQLFNEAIIQNKNMSLQIKLGKQSQQSSVLERPGKQLIIIDTFVFKRTWEETMKITIELHTGREKLPFFFADVNLRELFDLGRYASKKVKLKDENKNYSGELTLDMVYREQEEKKSPTVSVKQSVLQSSELIPQVEIEEMKLKSKRSQIEDRIRRRQQERAKSKQIYSMSTLAVLQENDIILPPLKSSSRMQTLSPKNQKHKPLQFNMNGNLKFSKSPRFESAERPGYESYTYVRESDFDARRKKGTSIGLGNKYDFVKPVVHNPGVGRYEIPSVWDKYK